MQHQFRQCFSPSITIKIPHRLIGVIIEVDEQQKLQDTPETAHAEVFHPAGKEENKQEQEWKNVQVNAEYAVSGIPDVFFTPVQQLKGEREEG